VFYAGELLKKSHVWDQAENAGDALAYFDGISVAIIFSLVEHLRYESEKL
jgi:hypothetical protein